MEPKFTTEFDEKLLQLPVFKMRPFQLPFLGNKMPNEGGVLFVLESHYVDPEFFQHQKNTDNLNEGAPDLFYNVKEEDLTDAFKQYLNTRQIIVDSSSKEAIKAKGKSVYRKLTDAVEDGLHLNESNSNSSLDHIAICNYFHRPSYKAAATIKTSDKDSMMAYQILQHITDTVNIRKIIFLSAKAYDSFTKTDSANGHLIKNQRKIFRGVHPRIWGHTCSYETGITWKQWIVNRLRD